MMVVELDKIRPMIAMPFHPSNTYTIDELNTNLMDILDDVEKKAQISLDGKIDFTLKDKVRDGKLYVEQGIIAGLACAPLMLMRPFLQASEAMVRVLKIRTAHIHLSILEGQFG